MIWARLSAPVGILLLVGTIPGQTPDKKPVPYESSFYPLRVGNQWRYKVTVRDAKDEAGEQKKEDGTRKGLEETGKNTSHKVVVTVDQQEIYKYAPDNKQQNIESVIRFRLKVVSDSKELTEHVAVLKDGVYRFTSADKDITPPLRFLKLPLMKGETWTVSSMSENMQLKGTFTCDDETVTVKAGTFQAKHVFAPDFQLGMEKMALDYWFAENVGIVKQRVRVSNSDVLLELEEFKTGK